MITPENAYSISKKVIQRFSPEEEEIFELMWMDYINNPEYPLDNAQTTEREIAGGLTEVQIFLISAIVIPLVVNLLTMVIEKSVNAISEYIRNKQVEKGNTEITEETARQMAEFILKLLDQEQNNRKVSTTQSDTDHDNG